MSEMQLVAFEEGEEASSELVPQVKDTMVGRHYLGTVKEATITLEEFERERRAGLKKQKAQVSKNKFEPGSAASIDGYRGSWGAENREVKSGPSAEELAQFHNTRAHEQQYVAEVTKIRSIKAGQEHSIWHGWSHDPDLKTVLSPPKTVSFERETCKPPRRMLHCWTGYPVQVVRMLGEHLIVSGGHDAQVKLWSALGEPWECLRTFYGHNKPIRDVAVTNTHLVTLSHERTVQRWDIEEGVLDGSLSLECQPMACLAKDSLVYVATVEGVVKEWDSRTGSWTRQFGIPKITELRKRRIRKQRMRGEEVSDTEEADYNPKQGHDGPISCFGALDSNHLVTAGEDRTVRLWDLRMTGEEVLPCKVIELDYLPTAMLVNDATVCLQSAANAIQTLDFDSGMLRAGRRRYTGHRTDGHACQMTISPDARWLASGSADGKLVIWDWRSGQLSRRLEAHERAMHGVAWNPAQGCSRVVTCSWDGSIKYWE